MFTVMIKILDALGIPVPSNFNSVMLLREVVVSFKWFTPFIKDVILTGCAVETVLPEMATLLAL